MGSAGQAEAHLALLNAILRATRAKPLLAGLLGLESDVAAVGAPGSAHVGAGAKTQKINEKPHGTDTGRGNRVKISGDRIVDPDESSSGDKEPEEAESGKSEESRKRNTSRRGISAGGALAQPENFKKTRPLTEADARATSGRKPRSPAALRIPARSIPKASFVSDYLVAFVRLYGRGGHHSSRELRKTMADVRPARSALRSGVLEGQSVNYQELNRLRVSAMSSALAGRKAAAERSKVEDAAALEQIMAGG